MLLNCTSGFTRSYTYAKLCSASGLPVDRMQRSADRSCVARGVAPSFSVSASHFALVPNTVTRSDSTRFHRMDRPRSSGAPSYSTTVLPTASADTSQFHIIQPQVVT